MSLNNVIDVFIVGIIIGAIAMTMYMMVRHGRRNLKRRTTMRNRFESCSVDDVHDAVCLLDKIEKLLEIGDTKSWCSISSREDLQAIFFHVSRIRSKILDKWQENGYSEEAMRVKEEKRRMLDEERIEYDD